MKDRTKDRAELQGSARIPIVVRNGIMFFNCSQETIERAVENDNRRKAYLRIGEWEDIP